MPALSPSLVLVRRDLVPMPDNAARQTPVSRRCHGDQGTNLVEYAMLISLILVVCLSAVSFFGNKATKKMSCASSAVTEEAGGKVC